MSVETFDVQAEAQDAVRVTPTAAEHFRRQLEGRQLAGESLAGVRLSLKKSGCTGYRYVIEEVAAAEESDVGVALPNGVQLFLSATDVGALTGMEVDYVQEGVNRKLVINNPNAKDACGCGESFSF